MGFSTSATGGGGGGGSFGLELGRTGRAAWLAAASLLGREGASWLKMLEREDRALALCRSRVVSLNIRSALEGEEPLRPRRSLNSETQRSSKICAQCRTFPSTGCDHSLR